MAKVLVALCCALKDDAGADVLPIYYESFIKGLDDAGNDVLLIRHEFWNIEFAEIDEETKAMVQSFNPDICILFNNAFYDLSEIVSCPIIIWEADSPRYFSNKSVIRQRPDRFLYFIAQPDNKDILVNEYGVDVMRIFIMSNFSEVKNDINVKSDINVSFIGNIFVEGLTENPYVNFLSNNPSEEEKNMWRNCLREIRSNPNVTPTELIYKYNITSELVARNLNIPRILMILSAEKRIQTLSIIEPLGLELYGPKAWWKDYYYNTMLSFSYINRRVYSLAHNQEIYNRSKIGINISHLQATNGFPWRVMDIMASNACLVTEYHSKFDSVFPECKDILPTYSNLTEAYSVCKKILDDESYRKEIVLRCNEVIDSRYRFKHLLREIEEYSGVLLHKE